MTIRAFLAAVALTTWLSGVARAQQAPPQGEEQGDEQPPQQYAPPPQQYAPPPGYAPPPENAPPENAPPPVAAAVGLGAAGQLVISDDLKVAATRSSVSASGTSQSSTSITLQPAIDLFIAPNLSIGGQVLISLLSFDSGHQTTIGLLPRIGYNIPIGPMASIWPHASLGYIHNSSSVNGGGSSTSGYTFSFIVFVPLLFQPATHFFIGAGPYLSTDLISKVESIDGYKTTTFGLLSTIGGYFGGT